ncbi:glutamine amidotransferase-related protein [Ktedonospora formicarum]|uniref:CTP synthase (glutamine hydrolyzing) n=1 Tax=Ktedonospora formicarum TaxID=2778364 RepID=A0A8J3MS19_9CHLR|nr:hypothetical protein [Ktedonospora formicarum]GHO44158.1 hypothetical protein KSX_23210 [Ktedonospora formicarum]
MDDIVRIGLIGDGRDDTLAHQTIIQALENAAHLLALQVEAHWLPTSLLEFATWSELATFNALWCVSADAYVQPRGVIHAIRLARELWIPFLGTCLGFHYTLIEYAQHVLSLPEADHGEHNPLTPLPLISPLLHSLSYLSRRVNFIPSSSISQIYGADETVEEYGRCEFGLDPRCRDLIEYDGLRISGFDRSGEVHAIELPGHPFFFATLYQPELYALRQKIHPLLLAFLRAAA